MFWNKPKVSGCTSCSEVKAYRDMDGSLHSNQEECGLRNKLIKEWRRRELFIKDLESILPMVKIGSPFDPELSDIIEIVLRSLSAKGLTLQIVKIKDVT
jgi:hypothetical protein